MQKMPCFRKETGHDKFKKTKTKQFSSRKPLLDLAPWAGFDTIFGGVKTIKISIPYCKTAKGVL